MTRTKRSRGTSRRLGNLAALLIVGGGALLLLLGVWAILGQGPADKAAIEVAGQPRLNVDRDLVDLGDVRLGQTVEVTFLLGNVGDQPLRLTRAPYVEVVEGC